MSTNEISNVVLSIVFRIIKGLFGALIGATLLIFALWIMAMLMDLTLEVKSINDIVAPFSNIDKHHVAFVKLLSDLIDALDELPLGKLAVFICQSFVLLEVGNNSLLSFFEDTFRTIVIFSFSSLLVSIFRPRISSPNPFKIMTYIHFAHYALYIFLATISINLLEKYFQGDMFVFIMILIVLASILLETVIVFFRIKILSFFRIFKHALCSILECIIMGFFLCMSIAAFVSLAQNSDAMSIGMQFLNLFIVIISPMLFCNASNIIRMIENIT